MCNFSVSQFIFFFFGLLRKHDLLGYQVRTPFSRKNHTYEKKLAVEICLFRQHAGVSAAGDFNALPWCEHGPVSIGASTSADFIFLGSVS